MYDRSWLGLFLIAVALSAPLPNATAQHLKSGDLSAYALAKPSHHDLPGGLDLDNPQELMAQRLKELHELHQLQDQVQGLLNDPKFLNSIRQQFTEEQLRRLREKMLKGESLRQDSSWNELLNQAASHKKLDQQQIDKIRRWAEGSEPKQPSTSEHGLLNGSTAGVVAPSSPPSPDSLTTRPSLPPRNPPEPSVLDRMQEETTKWMMEHLDDVGGDVLEALTGVGTTENVAPLAELLRSLDQPDFSDLHVSEQAMELSRYLPKVSAFLHEQRGAWSEVRSIFRDAPVPSLPSFGGSAVSLPSVHAPDSNSWQPVLLSLLMVALIVFLLSRMAVRAQRRGESGEEKWRLGSWPVAPDAVSTRQDVIRAFEYLALLCFGPAAGTCHHRELAERLAEQDNGNPTRRQAAEMLAYLYEQARYAPADEALSPEELTDARYALCCLSGVTAS